MAKKKKRSAKKAPPAPKRSPFWALSGAILMMVLGLVVLLGGLHSGGPAPRAIFNGCFAALGWAAYIVPFGLVYWGCVKFASDDHKISLPV